MTEGLIIAAMAVSAALLSLGQANNSAFAKIAMLGIMVGSTLLHIVGRALTAPQQVRRAVSEVISAWWPIMLLSIFILAGSTYARTVEDIKETFLGFGLGMIFLPLFATAIRSSARPLLFMKWVAVVYVLTVIGLLVLLALQREVFHEEIFVAVPLGAYFLCARPLRFWQATLGFALVGACLMSVKNTTFLLALSTLSACTVVWISRISIKQNSLRRVVNMYFGTLILVGVVSGMAFAYFMFRSNLPDGSPAYRMEMYGIAWRRFLDSPVWGTGFTDSAVTYFELYRIAAEVQTLPTHSDVLDLLAHGGVIAFTLWALTAWKLLAIGWSALRAVAIGDDLANIRAWRWLFVVSLVEMSAIITYAVNPLIHRPVHGIWIWGSAGLMWALHRTLTDRSDPATTPFRAPRASAFA